MICKVTFEDATFKTIMAEKFILQEGFLAIIFDPKDRLLDVIWDQVQSIEILPQEVQKKAQDADDFREICMQTATIILCEELIERLRELK
jgi:hypothetical protein